MKSDGKAPLDILFVVSPANANSYYMPYYYLYLVGYLEKHGYSADIADPHEKSMAGNAKVVLDIIQERQPRFIGLAAFVTDYQMVVDLANKIRTITNAPILVGNAQPSIVPEDFLYEKSPFDIVVRGEGELTVRQILSEYNRANLESIKGIAYFDNGVVKYTEKRELMDLADCGMPAYHKIDIAWYKKVTKFIIRRLATVGLAVYTGRGCPYACTFCASNTVWNTNKRLEGTPPARKRPLTMVLEELRLLQDHYGFEFFYILDDTFGIRKKDVVEFCEAYMKSGLSMQWAAETRVNCIDDEGIVRLLKEAGCIQLDFGVESGSPRILEIIRKKISVADTKRAFDLCRRHNIRTFANILVNLPDETEEDLSMTVGVVKEIKPTYVSVGATQPYPGTPIYESFGCKILKKDYEKLSRLVPSEELRLASHKINLHKLLFSWQFKFGSQTFFERSLFIADKSYWLRILKSNNRFKYLGFIVKDLILMPCRALKAIASYHSYRFFARGAS